jgi:hypothetical protein
MTRTFDDLASALVGYDFHAIKDLEAYIDLTALDDVVKALDDIFTAAEEEKDEEEGETDEDEDSDGLETEG